MALHPEISKIARQRIGLYLSDLRKHKKISVYRIAKDTGMTQEQIRSIEKGDRSYTIDSFLAYIKAIDCYFYLANRDGKENDLDNLVKQMDNPA